MKLSRTYFKRVKVTIKIVALLSIGFTLLSIIYLVFNYPTLGAGMTVFIGGFNLIAIVAIMLALSVVSKTIKKEA